MRPVPSFPTAIASLLAFDREGLLTRVKESSCSSTHAYRMKHTVARYALMGCGWLALGFAVAGLVLPVLPTAPFVLLAAACFLRSSEHLHSWIVEHPAFGVHVRDYLAGKGLRRRSKLMAYGSLWASVLLSVTLFVPWPVADAAIVVIAMVVTVYIARLPTCGPNKPSPESD